MSKAKDTERFHLPHVAGRLSSMSNADFERACLVHIERLQHGIGPYDSAMMATFCEAVRMVREYSDRMNTIRSNISDLEHELAEANAAHACCKVWADDARKQRDEARACLREIIETWDGEAIESIEDGCCPMMGPDSMETLVRWRTAAGYDKGGKTT